MARILRAEEVLYGNFFNGMSIEIDSGDVNLIEDLMIEFAKAHVEAALKTASEKAIFTHKLTEEYQDIPSGFHFVATKDSILSAYPLDNIK